MPRRLLLALASSCALAGPAAHAGAAYLGVATLGFVDQSGLTGMLDDGVTPANLLGTLSALAWTGQGNSYLMLPDRGPNYYPYAGGELVDNTRSFVNRVQEVEISVSAERKGGWKVAASLKGTRLLSSPTPLTGSTFNNPERRYFTGLSSGIDAAVPSNSMRLDTEGLRVANDGQRFFVSDEYGPFLYEFDLRTGQRIRSLRMPTGFLAQRSAATGANEYANNLTGRQPNKGMEGLAITPDGNTLVGLMQAPLLQDHAINPDDGVSAVGINTRMIQFDLEHCAGGDVAICPTRQFVYQQNSSATGNSEILAVNNHEFLVIERDGRSGEASTKLINLIDTAGATDVTAVTQLPRIGLPAGVQPVSKRLFIDLAAALKSAGQQIVEKYEGLAFGPDLPDGRHLLLVCVDNDGVRGADNLIYAFAIDRDDLPGFEPQAFVRAH